MKKPRKDRTIRYPNSFNESQWHIECPHCHQTIGFDGLFQWGWVSKAIRSVDKHTKITPMDFDGVIERELNYLVIETKDEGVKIQKGQLLTLERLHRAESFCVMKVWGKKNPTKWEAETNFVNSEKKTIKRKGEGEGKESAFKFVRKWFKWANRNKEPSITERVRKEKKRNS